MFKLHVAAYEVRDRGIRRAAIQSLEDKPETWTESVTRQVK